MTDVAGLCTVSTYFPDGTQPLLLGRLGPVSGVRYSNVLPGGAEAASCLLGREPSFRHPAMDPGRIMKITRGGSVVWTGKTLEPAPSAAGWTISAVGNGVIGADYRAFYSTWNQNDALDQAITRGLPWNKSSLSSAGLWLSQKPDPASITITDFLNLLTSSGAQTWTVDRYGTLTVTSFPQVTSPPTRLLWSTQPATRTVVDDVNFLYERYQATSDNTNTGATATFATTSSSVPGKILHQEKEDYLDLSGAGTILAATAQAAGNAILAKYQRASWAEPYTVQYGQYVNPGGVPVDLGCEVAGSICKLMVTDAGYGGEVTPVPIVFIVGAIEFDDDSHTAAITPYQAVTTDLAGMMSAVVNALTPSTTA